MARTNRGARRKRRTSKNNQAIVYLEVAGALLAAVVVIVLFSGRGAGKKPSGKREFDIEEVKKIVPRDVLEKKKTPYYEGGGGSYSYKGNPRPGKKPSRPAPKVDLLPGENKYREAKRLWDKALELRNKGMTGKAKELLGKAADLLEEAVNSVDDFNLWIEEADWNDWAIDAETMRAKKTVDRWLNLRSRIHKILPKDRR